jgi:putative ABC transport system permease protein
VNRRLLADSLRALRRYKWRSLLVALGTFAGTALVTLVLALAGAAQTKIRTTIRQLFGESSVLVIARGTNFLGGPRPDSARLTIEDIAAVAAAVPGVRNWDPQQARSAASVKARDRVTTVRVLGQSERSPAVWDRPAVRGTFFDAAAVRASARVAVIGETAAAALFPGEDPIGREIQIDAVPFDVIGVLQRFGTDLHGMDRDNEIVVPVTTMMRRVLNVDTIIVAKLEVAPEATGVVTEIHRVLRERHALAAGQPDDFKLMTPDAVRQMSGTAARVVGTYVPLGALAVLGLSTCTTALLMLSSVKHRTGEIGLRRAVGALAADISTQFAAETTAMTGAGGLAGVALGYAGARLVMRFWHLEGADTVLASAAGLVLALAAGLLASVWPARRAARIDPAVALR